MKKVMIDENQRMSDTTASRKLGPQLMNFPKRRDASDLDQAFVIVAEQIWRRHGLTREVQFLINEGDLTRVNAESVDDERREFLLAIRKVPT